MGIWTFGKGGRRVQARDRVGRGQDGHRACQHGCQASMLPRVEGPLPGGRLHSLGRCERACKRFRHHPHDSRMRCRRVRSLPIDESGPRIPICAGGVREEGVSALIRRDADFGLLNPDDAFTNLGLLLSDQCPPDGEDRHVFRRRPERVHRALRVRRPNPKTARRRLCVPRGP